MADWIPPSEPLGQVAAVAVADPHGPGPAGAVTVAELLVSLTGWGTQVAVVGADATVAAGRWRVLPDVHGLCRWVETLAGAHGIGPGLVAVLSTGPTDPVLEQVPRLRLVRLAAAGRPGDLVSRLREQVEHLEAATVPEIDHDPGWVVVLGAADGARVRVDEALAVVADGRVGTRGSLEEDGPESAELVLANGVYTDDPVPRGLPCPLWTRVEPARELSPGRRWFDLRTGVLLRHVDDDGQAGWRSVRFACLDRPGTGVLRLQGRVRDGGGPAVRVPDDDGIESEGHRDGDRAWATTWSGRARVVTVGAQQRRERDGVTRLDRVASLSVTTDPAVGRARAGAAVAAAEAAGVSRLLAAQRRAWAQRWSDADLGVDGDVELTRALRFAVHHLLAAVPEEGEAAVGARAMTGPAYAGHVFWDADVFVLPVLAAIRPHAARAMLAYRIARLPQARAAAAERGHRGACFPWESAADGSDVTPRVVVDVDGDVVPVLTREHALHITADVAWAAMRYAAWTGERDWLLGPGRDLVVETARFWASRVELDADGTGHLRGVMGPDEYHGPVDDDTYTNVMARWNLRAAATLPEADHGSESSAERQRWQDLADRIVLARDPVSGHHLPFRGFDALDPLLISHIAELPVAADVLLGRERVAAAQVCKQPGVLMAHHLVPGELPPESVTADLDYEGPRLAHGSSLSPAIVAAVLARAGRPDQAEPLFRLAAFLDLHDITATTAGGLHLAAMGGLWQALTGGFAGVTATDRGLVVDPHLPTAWAGVYVTLRHHGVRVRVEARHDQVTVTSDGPLALSAGPHGATEVVDGRRSWTRHQRAHAAEVTT